MSDIFQTLWDAPLSTRGTILIRPRGGEPVYEIKVSGLEHGKITLIHVNDVSGLGTVATFHEEGRTYWAGRGSKRGYAPASVWTALLEDRGSESWRYVRLTDTDLPRNLEDRHQRNDTFADRLRRNVVL
jgi:hypothetical protein